MTKLVAAILLFVALYLGALVVVELLPLKVALPTSPYLLCRHRYTVTAHAHGSVEWGACWWYLDEEHPEFDAPDPECRGMKHIRAAHPAYVSPVKPTLAVPPNWQQAHLDERVIDWAEIER